ncbi:MAG: cyclic nucleotide-binding domain-containing protein [Spirochaetales bacterium]|nr:cyclic nucleotide-binding domain-containing protein [Spirochaetales bacterium]
MLSPDDLRSLKKEGISIVTVSRSNELLREIGWEATRILLRNARLVRLPAGERLASQGSPGNELYLLLNGRLQASREEGGKLIVLGELTRGDIAGETALLTGDARRAHLDVQSDATLLAVGRDALQKVLDRFPDQMKRLAKLITARNESTAGRHYRPLTDDIIRLLKELPLFSTFTELEVRTLERELRWFFLPAGSYLLREGEPADDIYLVISGRLRYIRKQEGNVLSGELGWGDVIGEVALLTGKARSASVQALRDSEIIQLSSSAARRLLEKSPRLLFSISQVLAERLAAHSTRTTGRVRTIALFPVTPDLIQSAGEERSPYRFFADNLLAAFQRQCRAVFIGPEDVQREFGVDPNQLWLADGQNAGILKWFANLEKKMRAILLLGDGQDTLWNQRVLKHADMVLLVASATEKPGLSPFELLRLGKAEISGNRQLVLLHPDSSAAPGNVSRSFLENRHIDAHHHVRPGKTDTDRLVRRVLGNSIGLVLGGGGARGVAHLGLITALEEAGIPIDLVGGTSAGSIMGSAYALYGAKNSREIVRTLMVDQDPLGDYVLPLVSLSRGRRYSYAIHKGYGTHSIEDLFIPFYSVATNLTHSREEIFDQGPIWKAVRASTSLPGIVPPFFDRGQLFVDGGLLNNVPVDIMQAKGAGCIIAADVSGTRAYRDADYGKFVGQDCFEESPPLWQIIKNKLQPKKDRIAIPALPGVLLRSTIVGSAGKVERARELATIYARLPVDRFSLLDWEAFEELFALGYAFGCENAPIWQEKIKAEAEKTIL